MHEPVNYNDGVAFDRNSMMVLICPRCGNSEFSSDAMFCRICGADIYNRCEGEIIGSKIIEISRHKNPSNARYCEKCGKPTSFLNEHILCAYTDFVPLEEETGDNFSAAFIADVPQMEENHAVPAETPQPETVQASSFNDVDIDELPF